MSDIFDEVVSLTSKHYEEGKAKGNKLGIRE